ncbi:MAG: cell division protein FtsA [Candidatus Nealsonbacteria bacterium]
MSKPYIITALDIGSGSVKVISVLKKPKESNFEILGQGQQTSSGVKRGVIIDVLKVSRVISSLIGKIEEDSGKKIEDVYATLGGGHISSMFSRGLISVSRADQKISEEDINRVIQEAQTLPLSDKNKEIIETFPKEFIVDGEGGIKDPTDMQGGRLETDVLLLRGFSPYIKNSSNAILNSGLQINGLTPSPLASARAVLTAREKELGVCILDIGAGTTGMSVFDDGSLIHTIIFPIGSGHITNDIAVCLKTDIDTAEKIKLEFGTCKNFASCGKSNKVEKKIEIQGEEPLVFSQKMLSQIIEARVSEIFNLVNKELKKISKQSQLPCGIVLTGGGARIPGIKGLAKKELKLFCRIGAPMGISSFEQDPSLSALYGLILEGADLGEDPLLTSYSSPNIIKKVWFLFKKMFKSFIP